MNLIIKKNNYFLAKKKYFLFFLKKIKFCYNFLFSNFLNLKIEFGDSIEFDLEKNLLIIKKPLHIHCEENLIISSSKHLILDSGKGKVPGKEDLNYSIWLNSPKNEIGEPLKKNNVFELDYRNL